MIRSLAANCGRFAARPKILKSVHCSITPQTPDCSRINYIAACNNPDAIPAPLRSRLRTFDIPVPTPEQAQAIAENIIAEEAQARAPWMEFSEGAIDALCQLSPRRMRQMVQEALGRALYHGRDTVQAGDVACAPAPKRGIGFLA